MDKNQAIIRLEAIEKETRELKKIIEEPEKDWRNAVEEFHPGFMVRTILNKPWCYHKQGVYQHKPLHARGMVIDSSSVNSVKDKSVLTFALIYGGRIDFKYNKVFFRPDGRISYNESIQILESLEKKIQTQKDRFEKRED